MTTTLMAGLHFGESPRWHEGRLWYSDFYDGAVHAVSLEGDDQRVVAVPGRPSGLGWMPDGSLLVASMLERSLYRWDGSTLDRHADLSSVFTFHANDMVVDRAGNAYVGNFGFDPEALVAEHGMEGLFAKGTTTVVCKVPPDGRFEVAAGDLLFPNGMVITDDGTTLVVAETFAMRLTAFDVDTAGRLADPRPWADLRQRFVVPDGICLDAEGCIWVADATTPRCVRVSEGGEIKDEIATGQPVFACALGGPEGNLLLMTTAPTGAVDVASANRDGRIEYVKVDVPHAGLP